jgi:hypothetical protein
MGRTTFAVMRGAPDAEAQVFAIFELGTAAGHPDAPVGFGAQLVMLRHNQGRHAELVGLLRANVEAMPHFPAWRAVLARSFCEMDELRCIEVVEEHHRVLHLVRVGIDHEEPVVHGDRVYQPVLTPATGCAMRRRDEREGRRP